MHTLTFSEGEIIIKKIVRKVNRKNLIYTYASLFLLILIHHEFLVYYWISSYWKNPCLNCEGKEYVKILFVADPQLLNDEENSCWSNLALWDADRYEKKKFFSFFSYNKLPKNNHSLLLKVC